MANFTRQRASGLWVSGSAVTPAEFEETDRIRLDLINATDGSTHAPTSPIVIGGDGIGMAGPLNINAGGSVIFSANLWPKVSTRTVVIAQPLVFGAMSTTAFSQATYTRPTAYLRYSNEGTGVGASDRTRIRTKPITDTGAEYFDVIFTRVPESSRLVSASVRTIGQNVTNPSVKPTYQLFSMSVSGTLVALNATPTQDGHAFGTDWTTTERATTVTADSSTAIESDTKYYGLRVKCAGDASGEIMDLFSVTCLFDVEEIRV